MPYFDAKLSGSKVRAMRPTPVDRLVENGCMRGTSVHVCVCVPGSFWKSECVDH